MSMTIDRHVYRPDRTRETPTPVPEPTVEHMTPEQMDDYLLTKYGRRRLEQSREGSKDAQQLESLAEARKRIMANKAKRK